MITMRWRHWVYVGVAILVGVVLSPLLRETRAPDGAIWHAATFFGSILITVGWVVTSETAIRNAKRQHTISLITSHMSDPTRISNRKVIKKALPTYDTKLTLDKAGSFDDETLPLLEAIDMELNFYEFAAAGIQSDDIDEALLRECLRGQFCNLYRQNEDYINHWRSKRSLTWQHLSAMYQRWK